MEVKIKSYSYARRADVHLQREKKQLREMKRFDPRFARYSAGEPSLPLWKAKELDAERLQTAKAQRNRLLAPKGGRAKSRRTKNQQLMGTQKTRIVWLNRHTSRKCQT